MDLNNQSHLVLNEFSTFVNRLEYSKPIVVYPKSNETKTYSIKPEKTFEQFLEFEKIEITENNKTIKKKFYL